ncbi:hypothetical protein [Flavobacterium sp.]|uniref:hypothetical protein n=1 Tax=Flavobacterium sp. TaxID=239 RepID=UPI003529C1FB
MNKPKSLLPLIIMVIGLIIISIVAVTNNYWSESDEYLFSNKECKPYFDFDEVIHYQSNINDYEVIGRKNNDLIYLLFGSGFESLQDSIYLEKGDSLFQKKVVSKEDHSIIDKIFCKQVINEDELYFSECIAIYRDIFVFRKKNKITGIAKICFDCNQFTSIGAKQGTKNFGVNYEFSNLAKLIKKKEY